MYIIQLSKEHPTLPLAELKALLEVCGGKLIKLEDNLAVVEGKDFSRLAFAFSAIELLFECEQEKILDEIEKLHFKKMDSFMIRVKGNPDLEKSIGKIIKNKTGSKVNFKKPEEKFLGYLKNKFYFGKEVYKSNRSDFESRKVRYRPYFSPISLHPKYCRAMVNLARVKPGETVLDPFCGTGGILIEAGLLNCEPKGLDIENEMVLGTRENLQFFGLEGEVKQGDAMKLSKHFQEIDAIVTDPPYGRSASLKGEDINSLYEKSLKEMHKVLKKNGYIVITCPIEVQFEECAEKAGFKILEKHYQRVHKSLTRLFYVLRKQPF